MLIAFKISHTQNTKGHSGWEKQIQKLHKISTFQMPQFGLKYYATIV